MRVHIHFSKSGKNWIVIRYYKIFLGFLACYKVSQPKFVVPFSYPTLYRYMRNRFYRGHISAVASRLTSALKMHPYPFAQFNIVFRWCSSADPCSIERAPPNARRRSWRWIRGTNRIRRASSVLNQNQTVRKTTIQKWLRLRSECERRLWTTHAFLSFENFKLFLKNLLFLTLYFCFVFLSNLFSSRKLCSKLVKMQNWSATFSRFKFSPTVGTQSGTYRNLLF